MPILKPNLLRSCANSLRYYHVRKNTAVLYDFLGPCCVKSYSSKSPKSKVENSVSELKESVSKKYLNLTNSMKENPEKLYMLYREYTGDDKAEMAKNKVNEAEDTFIKMQQDRRRVQKELSDVQKRLKEASTALEKTNRKEKKYLELVAAEHEIIIEEAELMKKLKESDELERSNFLHLRNAIRQNHEAQYEKDEYMKKVNFITKVCSVIVSFLSVTYYYIRCQQLHSTVRSFLENQSNMESVILELTENLQRANNQQDQIVQNVQEMKVILDLKTKSKDNENESAVGNDDLENSLKRTEDNIEWKLKMNSLATVALVYGALAVTIPVIFSLFSGGN